MVRLRVGSSSLFVLLFARESRPSIIGRASEKKRRSLGPSFVKRW